MNRDDRSVTDLLLEMAKALATRTATIAWAKGLTHEELDAVWNACPDGRALMRLAGPVTPPEILVKAACACIRTAASAQRTSRRARTVVDRLEAWTQGTATWAEVAAAGDKMTRELAGGSSDITNAIHAAAAIADDTARAMDVIEELARSMSNDDTLYAPSVAHLAPARKTKLAALAELADVLRSTMPCPKLEQLARDS